MMKTKWFAVVSFLCLASVAFSQEVVTLGYWQTIDIVKTRQFEEGIEQHLAWRRQQGDTWRWNTWQLVKGERLGTYYVGSPNHRWKELDASPLSVADVRAHYLASVGDSLESLKATIATRLTEVSRPPAGALKNGELEHLITYRLKPGKEEQFMHVLARFAEAVDKTDWDGRYNWSTILQGGEPAYLLALRRDKWADFVPPEKTADKVMEEAFGRREGALLSEQFDDAIRSVTSEFWLYREDLSYIPRAP